MKYLKKILFVVLFIVITVKKIVVFILTQKEIRQTFFIFVKTMQIIRKTVVLAVYPFTLVLLFFLKPFNFTFCLFFIFLLFFYFLEICYEGQARVVCSIFNNICNYSLFKFFFLLKIYHIKQYNCIFLYFIEYLISFIFYL